MDEILTVQEVANYLKIDYATAWGLCNSGTLRAFRVGHVWRVERSALDRLIGRAPAGAWQQAANRIHGHPVDYFACGTKP